MKFDQLRDLLADDEAVSPVIGVILMVAITVILAAVIGTFVLGLGNQVTNSTAPTADFGFDQSGSSGTIVHNGGDEIDESNVGVSVTGSGSASKTTDDGSYTAGDEVASLSGLAEDDTIRVTWTSDGGGSSQTLAEFTAA